MLYLDCDRDAASARERVCVALWMVSIAPEGRNLSEDDSAVAAWVIILLVVVGLVMLFTFCVCFTVRCFTSQGKRGPLWSHTLEGQRWVDQWRWGEIMPNLVYENEKSANLPCTPGRAAV